MSVKPRSSWRTRSLNLGLAATSSPCDAEGRPAVAPRSLGDLGLGFRLRLAFLGYCKVRRLLRISEGYLEVVPVRGGVRCRLAVDESCEDEVDERLQKRLHLVELALRDRLRDVLRAQLADQVRDARVRDHHLDRGDPTSTDARHQPLADHPSEHSGEDSDDLWLLSRREELDHPADRLRGVERVQGRQDEMSGLRCLESDTCSLRVPELADQNDVRVLAEHPPETLPEAVGVEPDLPLTHDAAVVRVDDLDRVLDRDDVQPPRAVDVVEHRCERRRLPGSRRPCDEDEAAMFVREPRDACRQMQLLEARDRVRDDAEGEGHGASLPEAVDPEPRQLGLGVRDVEVARLVELLPPPWSTKGDLIEDGLKLHFSERRELGGRSEHAVVAEHRRLAELEVDIAGTRLDGMPEHGCEIHGPLAIGTGGGLL